MKKSLVLLLVVFAIFSISANAQQTLTTLHNFNWGYDGPYGDGWAPGSYEIWGLNDVTIYNGRIYGMTLYGGSYTGGGGDGVIYSCLPDGSDYQILHLFNNENDGYRPFGGLTVANGFLYGMTYFGGSPTSASRGCIFRISPYNGQPYTSNYEILHNFVYPNDIYYPHANLLLYNNKLWGICTAGPGGSPSYGGIFYWDLATSTYTLAVTFTQVNGGYSHSSLTLYNNRLYLTCAYGGANAGGSVLSINPNVPGYDLVKHVDLAANTNPVGDIVVLNNYLYFTSYNGGNNSNGAIWRLDPANNNLSNIMNLPSIEGNAYGPMGGLMVMKDKLWCATHYGGTGCGAICSVNPDATGYQLHYNFGCGGNGLPAHPVGTIKNSNHYIYGVTSYGGTNNNGTVYKYGPIIEKPVLNTSVWWNRTTTSFDAMGDITDNGGENCTRRGYCYSSTNQEPTIADNVVYEDGSFANGVFTININGLNPNTEYFYRAYAINSDGIGYGNVMSVTTDAVALAEVVSMPAENITSTSLTGVGNIISIGGSPVTQRGFCLSSTNSEPNINNSSYFIATGNFSTGEFRILIEYLTPYTQYYLRAYAYNSSGDAYGEVLTVNTAPEPLTVQCYPGYSIMNYTFSVNYNISSDGGSPVLARGIIYSYYPDPALTVDFDTKTNDGTGSGYFQTQIRGLETNLPFSYRAYAITALDTVYSDTYTYTINEPCLNVYVMLDSYFNGVTHKIMPVMIELRAGASLSASVANYRVSGLIDNSGRVKINYPNNNIESGEYWIVVRATGYLPIASNTRFVLDNTQVGQWNFKDSQSSTYQANMTKLRNGRYVMKAGDFNNDRRVNSSDLNEYYKPNFGNNLSIIPE